VELTFNDTLRTFTRPADWANPVPAGRYNLVVLGAGPAGLVCAAGAAGLGATVALVEREALGGDCLHVGCVPSKALIRCARSAAEARRAGEFGVRIGGEVTVDFPAVMERMRRLRAGLARADAATRFRDQGVDVFFGTPHFTGPDAVEVNGQTLRFARAVIATGSQPADPGVNGLGPDDYLTNKTVFNLTDLPRRLLVIGGGPIGCELAQAFARFGSEVHVFQRGTQLLPRDEPEAVAIVRKRLESDAVRLYFGAKVVRHERVHGEHRLLIEQGGQTTELAGDAVLAAVGRRPSLEGLNLEAAGVASGKPGVQVDDFFRTTNPRVYAAGDICSPYKFTHAADAMARVALRNALFFGRGRANRLVIPHFTYTDPEVASVGLTAKEAATRGLAIDTFRVPLDEVDRAVLDGETEGFASVHVKKGRDQIVGATIVAAHAGDLIGELVQALTFGIGLGRLATAVRPYPTQSEVIKRLSDAYSRTRLTPGRAKLLRWLLSWRRG
jgi:pyruvate/2-oxoglutarate dehydrogenase complex dihydrolipoamide dehydrogenase (E3) component